MVMSSKVGTQKPKRTYGMANLGWGDEAKGEKRKKKDDDEDEGDASQGSRATTKKPRFKPWEVFKVMGAGDEEI